MGRHDHRPLTDRLERAAVRLAERVRRRPRGKYHEGISEASAAAMMWYHRNVPFFEQALDQDPRVLLVSYERLVERPREEFLRIFRFVGLEFDPWVARRVSPRSPKVTRDFSIEPRIAALCRQLGQKFDRLLQEREAEKG